MQTNNKKLYFIALAVLSLLLFWQDYSIIHAPCAALLCINAIMLAPLNYAFGCLLKLVTGVKIHSIRGFVLPAGLIFVILFIAKIGVESSTMPLFELLFFIFGLFLVPLYLGLATGAAFRYKYDQLFPPKPPSS